jgi:protein-S-isoprenylcysteine O-methyltransferase Ste14
LSYAAVAQRVRVPVGFLLAAFYLIFARPTPLTLAVGAIVAFVGVLFRAWAAGHIVKNHELATTGPYAHTRNPLYFGSFLIAAGFAIAAHWGFLLPVIAFFGFVYLPVIEREREFIRSRFPGAYDEYERNVPAFVPRPAPWRSHGGAASGHGMPSHFDFGLYLRHREWQAALAYAVVILFLILRMRGAFLWAP